MEIGITDARALFTKTLVAVYQQRLRPTDFLRSFFKTEIATTKTVSIEVERQGEYVAVDVFRGSEGNRNAWGLSTEKIFLPPLYKEYFDATQIDLYDRVLGSQGNANPPLLVALANKVADRLSIMQDYIDRAIELQCAQILQNGQISITAAVSGNAVIDYRRKAASQVDLVNDSANGGYFAANSDVFNQFQAAGDFLRQTGKMEGSVIVAILGTQTLHDLLANTKFTTRQNLFNMALDLVLPPQKMATGATYHGTLSAGAYKVQLWAYPQFYDTRSTTKGTAPTSTAYVNPKYAYCIPEDPKFKLIHAAVPQLINEPGQVPIQGAYLVREFLDVRQSAHDFEISTAPIAIPIAVDQIYSMKCCA